MRWIKASERLPKDAVTHSARINYKTPEYTSITAEDTDVFIGEETHYTIETFPTGLLELIEWLDESIQDVPDTNVGEIDKCLCVEKPGDHAGCSYPFCERYSKAASQPTETPAPGEVPADIDAWIKEQYNTNGDFPTYRQGAEDLWLKVRPELSRLKDQLTEASYDRDVYKQWHNELLEKWDKATSDIPQPIEDWIIQNNPYTAKELAGPWRDGARARAKVDAAAIKDLTDQLATAQAKLDVATRTNWEERNTKY